VIGLPHPTVNPEIDEVAIAFMAGFFERGRIRPNRKLTEHDIIPLDGDRQFPRPPVAFKAEGRRQISKARAQPTAWRVEKATAGDGMFANTARERR